MEAWLVLLVRIKSALHRRTRYYRKIGVGPAVKTRDSEKNVLEARNVNAKTALFPVYKSQLRRDNGNILQN